MIRKLLYACLIFSLLLNGVLLQKYAWPRVKQILGAQAAYASPSRFIRESQFALLSKPQPEATVFVGDSITAYFAVDEYFPELQSLNRGISGDTTAGVLARLSQSAIAIQPRHVVLLIGTNDVAAGVPISTIADNYEKILDELKAGIPGSAPLVVSVLPTTHASKRMNPKIQELNAQLQRLAQNKGAHFIDIWSSLGMPDGELDGRYTEDGLHLNGEGYRILAEQLRPHLGVH